MIIGKVIGNLWATHKEENMQNLKLLIVQPLDWNGEPYGLIEIAVDRIGSGVGEKVLMTRGTQAHKVFDNPDVPIDAAIVGIVDSIEINESLAPRKSNEIKE